MKITTAICALAIAASSLTLSGASAAERPTSVPGCSTPKSKAHAPATLKQPSAPDKKLAKTMTIKTNCGKKK
jgi:peptidyl-prolyl cis-trans isomerase B (cyclophilin B)